MIRYRYGPWDQRYRQFLAFLISRDLVTVTSHRVERVKLKAAGTHIRMDALRGDALKATIDFHQAIGCRFLIVPGDEAFTDPDNLPSQRVLQRCGFDLVGETVTEDDGRLLRWLRPLV